LNVRVLIAPDKFAGTLDAADAARAIATGWRRARPDDEVTNLPLADGGPGTVTALAETGTGTLRRTATTDPFGRPITATWLLTADGTAVAEVASTCGLHLIAPEERDPLRASSAGLGTVLDDVRHAQARRLIVGLGGTGTSDGGAGAFCQLGASFLDHAGVPLPRDGGVAALTDLGAVGVLPRGLPPVRLASDVRSPLLGPAGAAHVFGPQKGAGAAAVRDLEAALTSLADVVERDLPGGPWRDCPGAGAAGGIGFGLLAWADAEVVDGAALVGEAVGLEAAVARADVVVTGEGSLDRQTAQGKVPEHVRRLARAAGRPVLVVAGRIEPGTADGYDDHVELGPVGLVHPVARCVEAVAELVRRRLPATPP
jgi:glycerate kinase